MCFKDRRSRTFPILLLVALLLSACTGPSLSSRISRDRAAFESWPAEVRSAIEAGEVRAGFTPQQVRMAWGEPSHVRTEIRDGSDWERWTYEKRRPSFSIGIGVGGGGGNVGVGGSVGTTVGGDSNIRAMARFRDGVLESFEGRPR